MRLVKWDPFREFLNTQHRVAPFCKGVHSTWRPAVDIFEKDDDLVIRMEIPGVDKSAIDVKVEDGVLVISGERKQGAEIKEENAYRLERSFGEFSRSFRLSEHVDSSRINATYTAGILDVTLPKAAESKPRKIEIQAA